ncbi:MAG: nucleotidyltransferase domain-containing protein [Conexivisphaerales archaeon]
MTKWIPNWLAEVYSKLFISFRSSPFTVRQAEEAGIKDPQVTLPRLARYGWIRRIHRGEYIVSEPVVTIISSFQADWREMVRQQEYVPLLESILERLLDGYGQRLKGLILFGSVARGKARPESDLDLIVVAEGMPERYGDRVRKTLSMLSSLETIKRETYYKKMALHPNIDLILIDKKEFGIPSAFYLDVVMEGIIMFERENFIKDTLEKIRTEFKKIGAARVEHPDGRWHWIIPTARRA